MSEDSFGNTPCYICKAPLAPLVSICWTCGYSQLPNPEAEAPGKGAGPDGPAPAGHSGPATPKPARDKLRADLQARMDQAKADLKSRLNKK